MMPVAMLLTTAAWAAVAGGGGAAPVFHAVAFVNDPLSHGQVGDGLLSLNEAILMHNGQLAYTQLSPAEQAQLSLIPGTGSTTDVTWIDIDTSNTPVITIQQDLAPVLAHPAGREMRELGALRELRVTRATLPCMASQPRPGNFQRLRARAR
jgi:hypothetical protein